MPFTIAHVAAVLPFSRYLKPRQLLSAAIVGSMAPDFGIFLPFHLMRTETHSLLALATFVVPVALASYWLFQLLIKPAILAVLPDRAYQAAHPFAAAADIGSLRAWILALIGILFGALTHLAWDAFTHEGARGIRMIPALDELVLGAGSHHVAGQRLLQDVSSVVGLAIIGCWLALALYRQVPKPPIPRLLGPRERALWQCLYVVAAIVIAIAAILLMHDPEPGRLGLSAAATDAAVAGLRGLGASLLAVSLILDVRLFSR
jgi:Domain of unknown function (DUF4184)